uniref:Portal protein n=1 Tax=viral metagenome TaxID=1070528 RepID=A0A6M3J7D3_9ZZZZ
MRISQEQALQLVKDKENDFGKLYARQDRDADFAKRKKFTITDDKGKAIPKCFNVTLPKAANFASRANSILSSSNERVVIEGQGLNDKVTAKIENFYNDSLKIADDFAPRKIGKIFTFTAGQANLRGRVVRKVLVDISEEGFLEVRIQPWDARFATYDFDADGTAWAACPFTRSQAMIESEYGIKTNAKTGKIIDFCGRDEEHIYLDGKHIKSLPNPSGEVPVAISYTSAGLPFFDTEMEENLGESIFWQVRDLFDEANRIASVAMTLHVGSLFPPVQKPYQEVPNEQPPSPYGGTMTTVPFRVEDGPYTAFPRADLYQATRFIWSLIDSHIQQGSFSTIEFGTLNFPLSAVALEGLAEGRELVLLPGLQAISNAELQTCLLIKHQFIALGKTVEIRGKGKRASYSPKDIEGDYSISFKYFTGSRKYALAGIAEAQQIGNLVSDDYKRRELIRVENPDEEAEKLMAEKNPFIMLYRQCEGLVEREQWAEAWMARIQLMNVLKSQLMGQPVEEEKQPQSVGGGIPLFAGAPSKVGGRQPGGISAEETRKGAAVEETEEV